MMERSTNIERSATTSGPHENKPRSGINQQLARNNLSANNLRRGSSQTSTVSSGSNTIIASGLPTPPINPDYNSSLEDIRHELT
ncbi:hypothetical protein Ciccas_004138 [Cichlidogyrus casuarinus]|uniref:Uncharacterized protein n=1 Tax=Cichlidogyrus casuarinus TaxID=1844966 RepID=A0ABD2QD57_9PLAT